MLIKCLLYGFELCISRMFVREVLMFSTERGSKDMAVDGAVFECADSTIVHADLTEKHIIERTGLLFYFIYRNDDLQVVFLRYLVITYAAPIVLGVAVNSGPKSVFVIAFRQTGRSFTSTRFDNTEHIPPRNLSFGRWRAVANLLMTFNIISSIYIDIIVFIILTRFSANCPS